jgi:hypothetical protein
MQLMESYRIVVASDMVEIHIPLPGDPNCNPGFGITILETSLSRRFQRIAQLIATHQILNISTMYKLEKEFDIGM